MATKKTNAETLAVNEFKLDGKKYRFTITRFSVPGFDESTPLEAKTNKELLKYLLAEKSGVIEEIA